MLIICKFGFSFGLILHSLLILPTVGPLEMQKRHNCQTHLRLTKFSSFTAFMKGTRHTTGTISDLGDFAPGGWC